MTERTCPESSRVLQVAVRHFLSDVDHEAKTGTCSVCGPVKISVRGSRRPVCITVRRRQQERSRRRKGQQPRAPGRRENPADFDRRQYLKHKYGLTLDAYQELFETQEGRCAICGQRQEESLSIDHDHACCPGYRSCGRCVRGLLCRGCNLALGYMRDDPELLMSAVKYLAKNAVAVAS